MAAATPTRIGIVGLGRAGAIHFDALRQLPGAALAAVCDPDAAARARAAAAGVPAFATLDAMLDAGDLHGVVVGTPPDDHAATTLRCLERGLHVLCEKPLALTTWDVLTMLQAGNRAHRRVLVASKFRHVPEVARARAVLAAGELGDPVSFEISFCSPVDMRARWNSVAAHSGGGVIIDNGCHALDIVAFLFGGIRRVQATRLRALQPLAVEDSATLQVWAGEGVIGRVDVSWSLATPRDSYLVVHGSRGSLEVGWQGARLKRVGQAWEEIGGAYDKLGAHRAMLARFVDSIDDRGAPWISPAECLQVVAAVDAAYRSLQSGSSEWVAIQGARELDLVSLSAPANGAAASA
ncbi:MAG: Gfo/Idh/MocA family oxidoreductase [Deltaproteobacteria bacterium]|nr:Gfo/Idh/MocA family oxidoreductase [Deltaproteobacteria bacterium]